MESEIAFQLEDLPFLPLQKPTSECVFVGSGDSYAASLAVSHYSGQRALCCYPLDLVENPSISQGRVVYLVSISGRTKENILAAKAARKNGAPTVAVTAKQDSPLARSCDNVIELNYRSAQVATAGSISFTASLLTCLSLVFDVKIPNNMAKLFKLAEKQADAVVSSLGLERKSWYILGNGSLFPIAVYGALKLIEVIGTKAFAYPMEEFCHAPLFSARKKDAFVILGRPYDGSNRLAQRLADEGFSSTSVRISDGGMLESLLDATFFTQLLALKIAQRLRLKECYFLRNKSLLGISSDFIYG